MYKRACVEKSIIKRGFEKILSSQGDLEQDLEFILITANATNKHNTKQIGMSVEGGEKSMQNIILFCYQESIQQKVLFLLSLQSAS